MSEDSAGDDVLARGTGAITRIVSSTVKSYSCIFDDDWLGTLLDNSLLWNEVVQLKFRHVASRFITRITQKNLDHCTRLMKYVELRHIDNVTGYLGIRDLDEQFIYVPTGLETISAELPKLIDPDSDLILSTNQSFIQMQSYFFERVWSVATPAMQKIAEIERGVSHHKMLKQLINNPSEVCDAVAETIESSRSEILVVFPYANTFWCAYNAGVIASLGNKIKHNVVVRVIVHIDKNEGEAEIIKESVRNTLRSKNNDLYANISFLTRDLRVRNMFFIVDQVTLLAVDILNSTKKMLAEIVGTATFSDNETRVSATISVFDTLWIQSELEKQTHAKQAYFNIFKGFRLRQEEYRRKWLFEQKGARKPNDV
ncbi:MAG: hypothetical protein WCF07_11480 [Nitrososphaeraceae archaeon]